MKKLLHYEKCSRPELSELIKDDVSFTVLTKIVQGDCDHIFTDGKSAIVCHSNPPYPVWVWCERPDDANTITTIGQCIKEHLPLEKYNIIVQYEILERLAEYDPYFRNTKKKMELLSYRLDEIRSIDYSCDGQMETADMADIDILTKVWQDMCIEMEGFHFELDDCYKRVKSQIDDGVLFVWRNEAGEIVATTNKGSLGKFGKVAGVYTLPEYRRHGYAINLVHGVTKIILDEGLTPTLYTDGGYSASNECYKKIGYVQVGKLCTVYKG